MGKNEPSYWKISNGVSRLVNFSLNHSTLKGTIHLDMESPQGLLKWYHAVWASSAASPRSSRIRPLTSRRADISL